MGADILTGQYFFPLKKTLKIISSFLKTLIF